MMVEMLLASLAAGLATVGGAIAVLFIKHIKGRCLSLMLGFASGVMLAVAIFDLIPSAYQRGGWIACLFGFLEGILILALVDYYMSRWAMGTPLGQRAGPLRKMGYLIALGIALHDFPEGVAIAAGSAAESTLGWNVALAIGLHNVPEGIATAAPLRVSGLAAKKILALTLLMALFTPMGTLIGFGLLHITPALMAQLLALAGGAMLYIVGDELWPEAYKNSPLLAFVGLVTGFCFMSAISH